MTDATSNVPAHELSQESERQRLARAARIARIKQELLDRPRDMKSQMGRDLRLRLRVAENLWNIIEGAEERSSLVTRRAVLHAANKGRPEESTKRAPLYLCDPKLEMSTKLLRAKKLTHDPRKYVELAQATAALLDLDKDIFLLDLFAGTKFEAEVENDLPLEDPQREAWSTLLDWLQRRTRSIVEEFDLRRYFTRQIGWGLQYRDGKFEKGSPFAEEPTAFLGWVEPASPRYGVFRFDVVDPKESMPDLYTKEDATKFAELIERRAHEVQVRVHTILVLHLVIAPQENGSAAAPYLRIRCVTDVVANEYQSALEPFLVSPPKRGQVIAKCLRAIASETRSKYKQLPALLVPKPQCQESHHSAAVLEFDVGESEMSGSYDDFYGFGFDTGTLMIRDDLPGVPSSLISNDPSEAPRMIIPLGEETLDILNLQTSRYMLEDRWKDDKPKDSFEILPESLTALPWPLAEDWLNGDEGSRKQLEEIAAKLNPFKSGSMLAALDRACQVSDHSKTPMNQLRASAEELTNALASVITDAESQRDQNLRKSL